MIAILAAVLISLVSFAGLFTISIKKELLEQISFCLVAVAAGTFLGDAFLHLLPEAIEINGENELRGIFLAVLAGILIFFVLEEVIHWHHHVNEINDKEKRDRHHLKPIAITNLVGDGFHNFLDGVAIAASFSIGTELGIATFIAILLHEIPQEFADFGVLIYAGLERRKALLWNFASGLLSVLGVIVFMLFEAKFDDIEKYLLALIAGVFIYIATTDLFPEIHKNRKVDPLQIICVIAGIMVMYGLTLVE